MKPARWTAFALALALAAPTLALAQPTPPTTPAPSTPPGQGQMVVVMPFTGRATQDRLTEAEESVRAALRGRGAQAPERATVDLALGVTPPSDPTTIVSFARGMGATHVITGVVTPLTGQYNLALTLYEVPSARSATDARNVGDADQGTVDAMVAAVFAPGALGAAPVDPEAQRRAEEERRRQEEARRLAEEARAAEARRRAQAEAERARTEYDRTHPLRRYDQGGALALGARLTVGGVLGSPSGDASTAQPRDPASTTGSLRVEGAYALSAVSGLELTAGVMALFAPSTAFGLGVGAQFTFPAQSRLGLRVTGGALLGLYQGLSGGRLTSAWIAPQVRAEYALTQTVALHAGLELDLVPGSGGGFTALSVLIGARFRLGI